MQKVLNAIQRVRFTKSTPRQASIRCKAVDNFLFPHHEVVDNQTKKPKKGYYSHKRRESDDKNAVAIVKIVPQLGCVSQDWDAWVLKETNSPVETRCKNSWDQFEKYGSLSKDHPLEKYKSNLFISEVSTR